MTWSDYDSKLNQLYIYHNNCKLITSLIEDNLQRNIGSVAHNPYKIYSPSSK